MSLLTDVECWGHIATLVVAGSLAIAAVLVGRWAIRQDPNRARQSRILRAGPVVTLASAGAEVGSCSIKWSNLDDNVWSAALEAVSAWGGLTGLIIGGSLTAGLAYNLKQIPGLSDMVRRVLNAILAFTGLLVLYAIVIIVSAVFTFIFQPDVTGLEYIEGDRPEHYMPCLVAPVSSGPSSGMACHDQYAWELGPSRQRADTTFRMVPSLQGSQETLFHVLHSVPLFDHCEAMATWEVFVDGSERPFRKEELQAGAPHASFSVSSDRGKTLRIVVARTGSSNCTTSFKVIQIHDY